MMKLAALGLGLILSLGALQPAIGQTQVGVSVGINQPGVYGRIDIGNLPPPRVVSPQPIVIVQSPMAVQRQPIYLYVAPGHQKHWAKHCRRYQACGQPVYFVQEDWVHERAAAQRRQDVHRADGRDDDRGRRHGARHGG